MYLSLVKKKEDIDYTPKVIKNDTLNTVIDTIAINNDTTTVINDTIIPVYDTIKPLDYFPAHPSSFWIYDKGDTVKVKEDYQMLIFSEGTGYPIYDTIILPQFYPNSTFGEKFISEYSFPLNYANFGGGTYFSEFVSETLGDGWSLDMTYQGSSSSGRTIIVDTSMVVQGQLYNDVIVTGIYPNNCVWEGGLPVDSCIFTHEYYAKGVGLIKIEYKGISGNWESRLELVDYEIVR